MRKKGVLNRQEYMKGKLVLLVLIIVIILGSVSFVISQSSEEEKLKEAYEYGKEIGKFVDEPIGVQEYIIEDEALRRKFIEGLVGSIEGNDENFKKLVDSWLDRHEQGNRDGEFKLSKKVKDVLFKELIKRDKNFAKKFAKRAIERLKRNEEFGEKYFSNDFKEFIIDSKFLDKLEWEGSKLGVRGEDGKLFAWIDFNDLPAHISKIEIRQTKKGDMPGNLNKESEFVLEFGDSNSKIVYNSGGYDFYGFIVDVNGKRFGKNPLGIKSVKYDQENKKFTVGYDDFEGNSQTLEIDLSKLGEGVGEAEKLDSLMDILSDQRFSRFWELKYGESFDKDGLKEIIRDIRELGEMPKSDLETPSTGIPEVDELLDLKTYKLEKYFEEIENRFMNLKIPTTNTINLAHMRKGFEGDSEIKFGFNKDGSLEIYAKGGAVAVSTNIKETAGLMMGQDLKSEDPGFFKYNKLGELLETKNSEGIIFDDEGRGKMVFNIGNELTDMRIVRSTLAAAATSLDAQKAVESLAPLIQAALISQDPKAIKSALDSIKRMSENPYIEVETMNRLAEFYDKTKENLMERSKEIQEFVEKSLGESYKDITENPNFPELEQVTLEQTQKALNELTKPENIQKIVDHLTDPENEQYKDDVDTLIQKTLGNYVDAYGSVLSSDVVSRVIDVLPKGRVNEQAIKDSINEFIQGQNIVSAVRESSNTDYEKVLKEQLELIVTGAENKLRELDPEARILNKEKLVNDAMGKVTQIISLVESKEKELQSEFQEQLMKDLMNIGQRGGDEPFKPRLYLDVETGQVFFGGNGDVSVDTRMDLSKVSVFHDGSKGEFELNSYGKTLARFKGSDTYAPTHGVGKTVSVASIINEKNKNNGLMVLANGYEYDVISPGDSSRIKKVLSHYGTLRVTGIPLLGYLPILTHHLSITRDESVTDPGLDPNAGVKLTIIGKSQSMGIFGRGGFIARIINGFVDKKISGELANVDFERARQLEGMINKELASFREGDASKTLGLVAQTGSDFLKFADNSGIKNIPQRQAINDAIELSQFAIGENKELEQEMKRFFEWLRAQKVYRGMELEIKGDHVRFGNNVYRPENKVFLRQMMREAVVWGKLIPNHFQKDFRSLR